MFRYFLVIFSIILSCTAGVWADETKQFLSEHCFDCHGGDNPESNLDLRKLSLDLADPQIFQNWVNIFDRVVKNEMPPRDALQPPRVNRNHFVSSLAQELTESHRKRNDVVLRRLNQREFENTVQDLFGVHVRLREYLPKDNSIGGFDNVGEGLAISVEAIQSYLTAADIAVDAILGSKQPPIRIHHITTLLDQKTHDGKPQLEQHLGKMFRQTDEGLAIFQSGYCPTNLVNFARLRAPAGTYRGTMRVRAIQSDKPVILRVYGGDTIVGRREKHLVGFFEALPDQWTTIEFTDELVESGGTFQPKCYGTRDTRKDANTYPEAGIEIGQITIEGPLEKWPPESRKRLLGKIDPDVATTEDLLIVFRDLIGQAFRRPVTEEEIDAVLALPRLAMEQGRGFEEAVRIGVKTILCSPNFLFLDEPVNDSKEISAHALAARLSYFLWSSMPDEKLTALADSEEILNHNILLAQTKRMLKDPKSDALIQNFVGQWLGLRDIDFTSPDAQLYPEFDELLRLSMIEETELFFKDLLDQDRELSEFIDSDHAFLNQRLAEHYGIDGIEGLNVRRVKLPQDSVRGGILTQASILKLTANGTNTSPVMRGNWVLERLLDRTIPPPPSGVAAVEPDIRGATTVRQLLEKHRSEPSCSNCHRWIDPPGMALENFDAIGGWRDTYRTLGEGKRPIFSQDPHTFAWIRYRHGLPVNASGITEKGEAFQDILDFKRILLTQQTTVTRCITKQLLTYSLGRQLGFSDRDAIDQIAGTITEQKSGIRSLIEQIVTHDLFRRP
ncbi:DUF1592 domain-containing protein [bacterium]|nr:DUF1592 domain-containing protein [bacterium]